MNLEDIMLSEVSLSLKDKYHMIPFIKGVKFIEQKVLQKVKWWLSGTGGRAESCLMSRVSVLQDEEF